MLVLPRRRPAGTVGEVFDDLGEGGTIECLDPGWLAFLVAFEIVEGADQSGATLATEGIGGNEATAHTGAAARSRA